MQWATPDLNSELQIAVGSAGPQPGTAGADWAAPDLTRGSEDVSEICQKRMSERMSEDRSEEMSANMSKICQKICQKI